MDDLTALVERIITKLFCSGQMDAQGSSAEKRKTGAGGPVLAMSRRLYTEASDELAALLAPRAQPAVDDEAAYVAWESAYQRSLGGTLRLAESLAAQAAWLAASAQLAPSPWRDIATAPKDGTRFIGWDATYGRRLFTLHWSERMGEWMTDYEPWSGNVRVWMPLPSPPKENP